MPLRNISKVQLRKKIWLDKMFLNSHYYIFLLLLLRSNIKYVKFVVKPLVFISHITTHDGTLQLFLPHASSPFVVSLEQTYNNREWVLISTNLKPFMCCELLHYNICSTLRLSQHCVYGISRSIWNLNFNKLSLCSNVFGRQMEYPLTYVVKTNWILILGGWL